ncbi:hypothetical protein [Caminibacter pacificus]
MKKIIALLFTAILVFAQTEVIVEPDNEQVEVFDDNFVSQKVSVNVAVVIDKKKFFKFIPSIMNSINSYFIYKASNYHIKLFDIDANLSQITQNYKDIVYITTDKQKIEELKNYDAHFYVPTFNASDFKTTNQQPLENNETTANPFEYTEEENSIKQLDNVDFGLIDFKSQVNTLAQYIDDNYAIAINSKGTIPQKLLQYESELNIMLDTYDFPNIPYYKLKNHYIFFNTSASKTAQILAQITYKNIETKLQLATQIDYDPLLISITQPQDVEKLIIANSILNIPIDLEDTNMNLNSDIRFNWLNYDISILLNKIYNKQTNDDEYYMNDFHVYIFDHQINYNTKLYQIINGAFKPIQ